MNITELIALLSSMPSSSPAQICVGNYMDIHSVNLINGSSVVLNSSFPPTGSGAYTVGQLVSYLSTLSPTASVFISNPDWMIPSNVINNTNSVLILSSNIADAALITNLQNQINTLSASLASTQLADQNTINTLQNQLVTVSSSLVAALQTDTTDQATITNLTNQLSTVSSSLVAAIQTEASQQTTISNLQSQVSSISASLVTALAIDTTDQNTINTLQNQLSSLNNTLVSTQNQLSSVSASLVTALQTDATDQITIASLQNQLTTDNTTITNLQAQIVALQKQLSGSTVPLTPTTLTVSPSTISLTNIGATTQLIAIVKDQRGNLYTGSNTVSWSSNNTSIASVSNNGLVDEITSGSTSIAASITSGSAKLITLVPVVCSIPVIIQSSGSTHEPTGMTTVINTGNMITPPSNNGVSPGQWKEGTITFTNFSPVTPLAVGSLVADAAKNITSVPDGSGLRITYPITLAGGYSPVRWGTSLSSSGTGFLYVRWRFRLSPNWTLSTALGIKVMEPKTVNSGNNHVFSLTAAGEPEDGSNMWPQFLLQGNHYADLPGAPQGFTAPITTYLSSSANLGASRGTWHTIEYYIQPETPSGTGTNGQWTVWVDGNLVFTTVGLTPGAGTGVPTSGITYDSGGWNYLLFDPTYGGDSSLDHPPVSIYWDIDDLYVSVK